jgi:cellulose synthase operon protein C
MTDITNRSIPEPKNWQDFERLCFDLYRSMWKTNDAQMHGRQGQEQAGVDIYGTDRVEGRFVGVQCKGKDQGYGRKLTEVELRHEIEKAKAFDPPIDLFIVATTAPNDERIQKYARAISRDHAKGGLFEVRVDGWGNLQNYITDNQEVFAKHYSDLAPKFAERIEVSIAATERVETQVARLGTQLTALTGRLDAGDPIEARIIQAAKLTDDGLARAALSSLNRILQEDGNKLTPRHLFRLRSGFGFAHIALGDLPDAIQSFHDAYDADPEWPGARAILAVADLLEGNREAAFKRAREALRDDPTSHHAAAVILDSAAAGTELSELEALIPAGLQDRAEILLGLSLRARKVGDFATAEAHSRRAVSLKPDDLRATSSLAGVLLEPIFAQEGVGFTRIIPIALQSRFHEGLSLLQRAWEQLAQRDDLARYDHIAANLITALDVAGRGTESERILDQALRLAPRSAPLLRQHAQKMVQAGEWQDVLTTISAISVHDTEPGDALIKVQALFQTGSPDLALTEARALQERFGVSRDGEAAAAMRLEIAARQGALSAELDEILSQSPDSIVLRSVAVSLLDGSDPRRQTLLDELNGLVEKITDLRDRLHVAEALYAAKQYFKAADLYVGLHGTDQDNLALRRHLVALHLADRRLEARQLFDSLDDRVKILPQYAEAGAAIYERSGLLPECRDILERSLLNEENLQRRLQWLSLCERLNEPDKIFQWLSSVSPDQQGAPRHLMFLALAMDRYLGDARMLPIAYRALREGYDDPQIHLSYTVGLFLTGKFGLTLAGIPLASPTEVGPDTAVVLTEKDGPRRITRIIEREPNPRIDRDEIAVSDPFAAKLIGLRVGDEIELDSIAPENPHYIVSTVQNKYVYAHFRSLERFETMFPENRGFGSFNLDPAKGEQQFKPIFDAVKKRGEFASEIKDLYRSGRLPLAMAAKFGAASIFEMWEGILGDPDLQFNVVLGRTEDYAAARDLLSGATGRAIVDPTTLYGLVRLKIAEAVRDSFDDLGVVQTTIDLFRLEVQNRERDRGRQKRILGWDGEHYQMIELGPEAIEGRISQVREALEFAESLTVIPAEAAEGIKDDAKQLFEELDEAYLDTVLAAKGSDRVLLSDDGPLRALAAEAGGIKTVWTQAAVSFAAGQNKLSADSYFQIGNALADARYFFTTINPGNFFRALKESQWELTPTVHTLISLIARAPNVPQNVLNLLGDLAKLGWPQKPNVEAFERLFTAIFAAFAKEQPDLDLEAIANVMFAAVQVFLRQRFDVRFRDQLCESTYLKPGAAIARETRSIYQDLVTQIGSSLGHALRKGQSNRGKNYIVPATSSDEDIERERQRATLITDRREEKTSIG